MLRIIGARLAVPLLVATIVLLVGLDIAHAPRSEAVEGCQRTARGVVCSFSGSRISTSRTSRPGRAPRRPSQPLRYLAVSGGRCWYWSRTRPGFDSWNSAYDQSIILTRWRLPRCRGRRTAAPVVTVDVAARAWAVFRSFPLDPPRFRVSPETGITNLASRLHLDSPRTFSHSETLPDRRRLQVEAVVDRVWLEWGDGSPPASHRLVAAVGDPGAVRHTYLLKTCPADYRRDHLDGPKCHPALDRYPITVTLQWSARYRAGGAWIRLGSIDRTAAIRYDVDEVLGVLEAGAAP